MRRDTRAQYAAAYSVVDYGYQDYWEDPECPHAESTTDPRGTIRCLTCGTVLAYP